MPFSHLLIFDGPGRVRFGRVRFERGAGVCAIAPHPGGGIFGTRDWLPGAKSASADRLKSLTRKRFRDLLKNVKVFLLKIVAQT